MIEVRRGSMLRTQMVTAGILVGAVLLAGYSNNVLQVEIHNMNQSLHAAQQTKSIRDKELKECTSLLSDQRDHINGVERDKKLLAVNLTNVEQQFNTIKTRADSLRMSEKENEVQELKAKIRTAEESRKKERERLNGVQEALDKLAKEAEAWNAAIAKKAEEAQTASKATSVPSEKAVKSKEAQKESKAPAAPEKRVKSDGKKQ